jgi:hypothetical protein
MRKRRRWPLILAVLAVAAGGLWALGWHYAASVAERTVEGWKAREARSGRDYNCAAQTIGGFPFRFEYRCAGASADLRSNQPPLALKAHDILVSARLWQPTVLTSDVTGPMTVAERGGTVEYVVNWQSAQTQVRGLPVSPEHVAVAIAAPSVDRTGGGNVFKADRLDIDGRLLSGSVQNNPVIEIVVKLVQAAAREWHPAAGVPLDADITAVLRGLKDFAPKPWPQRFRELQAAGGRIEIAHARVVRSVGPRQRLGGQAGCGAAEVGRGRVLADLHDAAADRARAREMIEQRLAVARGWRGQRRQVLAEAAEHLQHRVLVGEEDVAPHGRVGGGDAGEVAEAAGGELQHLGARHLGQFVGGADDGVGDEMRQVAGDAEHQIVVLRS